MKSHETQVQTDVVFKDRFNYDNPANFMMSFETTNTKQYLEFRILESTILNAKYRKIKEIEWLEKNNISKKEIKEIFPDYNPKQFKDMYLVGEPDLTAPPIQKPVVAKKKKTLELDPNILPVVESAPTVVETSAPSIVDVKTKKNPKPSSI